MNTGRILASRLTALSRPGFLLHARPLCPLYQVGDGGHYPSASCSTSSMRLT